MSFLRGLLATAIVASTLHVLPALAEWPEQGRKDFTASCIPSCQARAQGQGDKCQAYCQCMTRELERAYPDPGTFMRLAQAQDAAYLQRVRALAQMCFNQ